MKLMLVAGARPNFMKIASIIDAIDDHNRSTAAQQNAIEPVLVHTGQHYDDSMSEAFFRDLDLPRPDIHLEVGSASHAVQTAEIMKRFEPVLLKERPDVVMVVGDVNSTIACTLVASKIVYPAQSSVLSPHHLQTKPLIAHVEAGLRSFDRSMPEEINRILTDQLSDFLFVSEQTGIENLKNEGFKHFIYEEAILGLENNSTLNTQHLPLVVLVGNTMIDTLLKHRNVAQKSDILNRFGLLTIDHQPSTNKPPIPYAVLTLHRPSNVDSKETFRNILEALSEISKNIPILFPVHPRTINRIKEFEFERYFDFDFLKNHSTLITQHLTLKSQSSVLCPQPSSPTPSTLHPLSFGLHCVEPLGYLDFLCLMSNAKLMLTDSGGIQEETTVLGVPCITLRENTERPVTITHGTNVLAGIKKEDIVRSALSQLEKYASASSAKVHSIHNLPHSTLNTHNLALAGDHSTLNTQHLALGTQHSVHSPPPLVDSPQSCLPPLWDGRAGQRIIRILVDSLLDS